MKNGPCWIVLLGLAGVSWYLLGKQDSPPQIGGSVTVSSGNGFGSSSSSSYVSTGSTDNTPIGSLVILAIVALFAISIFSKDK